MTPFPFLPFPIQPNPTQLKNRVWAYVYRCFVRLAWQQKTGDLAQIGRIVITGLALGLNAMGGNSIATTTARAFRCRNYTLQRFPGSKNRTDP